MTPSKQLYKPLLILATSAVGIIGLYSSGLLHQSTLLLSFVLVFIGGLLGASLNYFHFGFSSSFRALIYNKRTAGMRAILFMLALAILLFSLILATKSVHTNILVTEHHGFIRPLSLSIPIGAFIFGIGMQISCGCTSGTLNRVGQLQPLAIPTLLFMIVGGTLAAASFDSWRHLPAIEPFAFQQKFSWPTALALQALLLALLWFFLVWLEKQSHGKVEKVFIFKANFIRHPFLAAGLSLAVLNALLFFVSGSPWSISSVFPFWGTKAIEAMALPIDWHFWDYAMQNQTQLSYGLWQNPVSLTTMGVILGALFVTFFHYKKHQKCANKALIASSLGGLIMGYSAVLASGCNIGAFFSGIASGSLHGWVWFVFALLGNIIGIRIRTLYLNN